MAKHVLIVDDDAARQTTVSREARGTAIEEVAARVRDGNAIAGRSAFDLILQDLHTTSTGGLAAAVPARSQPKGS